MVMLSSCRQHLVCSHILVIGIRKYQTSGHFMVTVTMCKTKTLHLHGGNTKLEIDYRTPKQRNNLSA
ncbi:hypothetical protein VNO80_17769 [Phaseolus coccineus]|uniref:Uncharacterized protein n=1 Tax=Phaseolus coccineus TaxID=3886 RepID=A0AAN9MCY8_PHACN